MMNDGRRGVHVRSSRPYPEGRTLAELTSSGLHDVPTLVLYFTDLSHRRTGTQYQRWYVQYQRW